MLLMPSQISLYEEMGALSARMVAAARANDWDALVVLEHSVAVLREALQNRASQNPGRHFAGAAGHEGQFQETGSGSPPDLA